MIEFFLLGAPPFALVAVGWLAFVRGWAQAGHIDALASFSFQFALPALVLRLIGGQPLTQSFSGLFFLAYLFTGATVMAVTWGAAHWALGRSSSVAAAHATTASVSNLGFLGPPLMLSYFGERGAGCLAIAIVCEVFILMTFGGLLMSAGSEMRRQAWVSIARRAVFNPLMVTILLGVLLAAWQVKLPVLVDKCLALLGASAGPTALFALGGTLALYRVDRATLQTATGVAVAKLIVYPLMAWWIIESLTGDAFLVQAGVTLAALPPASSNFVLAQRYQADTPGVSAAIVFATAMSALTVPAIAWFVHP